MNSTISKIKGVAATDVHKMKKIHKFVPKAVSFRVARSSLIVSKHSPTILFGAGVIGFGATVVLACRATLRLDEVLEETNLKTAMAHDARAHNPSYTDADHKHDIAYVRLRSGLAIVKLYSPAIIMGTLSVAALTGSHHVLNKRYAGATAAYAATEKAFADYRARVAAEYGDEKDREFRHGVEERTVVEDTDKGPKKKTIRGHGEASQYAVVFEQGSNQNWEPTPEYNVMFLRTVQNTLNDQLHANGHVLLNDAYRALGYDDTEAGCVVGWVRDADRDGTGDGHIDFGIFSDEARDRFRDYVTGREGSILVDFNVDGLVFTKVGKQSKKKRGKR